MQKTHIRHMKGAARAFTLIEVLVVVAIIALLISILLPSLAAARESAKAVACRANLHSMGLAMTMYNNQYGYFPGHHHQDPNTDPNEFIVWPIRLMRFMNGSGRAVTSQADVYRCPSTRYKKHWDGRQRIWNFVTTAETGDCATFDYGYNDWGVDESFQFATVVSNLGLGGHVVDKDTPEDQRQSGEVRVSRVKRPAEMIVIADSDTDDPDGSPGKWDTAIEPTNEVDHEWPGARHSKGTNVLWVDGHADWQLQSRITEASHKARRRWNNDFRAHCKLWRDRDLPAGQHGGAACMQENIYSK